MAELMQCFKIHCLHHSNMHNTLTCMTGTASTLLDWTTHSSKYSTIISTVCQYGLFCLCFGTTVQIRTDCTVSHVTTQLHKVAKQHQKQLFVLFVDCWQTEYLVWDTWEITGSQLGLQLAGLKQYCASVAKCERHFTQTEREVADTFSTYSEKRRLSVHCSGDCGRCFGSRWSAGERTKVCVVIVMQAHLKLKRKR